MVHLDWIGSFCRSRARRPIALWYLQRHLGGRTCRIRRGPGSRANPTSSNPCQGGELDQGIPAVHLAVPDPWWPRAAIALVVGTPLGFLRGCPRSSPAPSTPSSRCCGPCRPRLASARHDPVRKLEVGPTSVNPLHVVHDVLCAMWAYGAEHGRGGFAPFPGLHERGPGPEAVPLEDAHQGDDPRDSALHVHRISPQPWHCLAGHRGGGNISPDAPGVGAFWQQYNASLIYASRSSSASLPSAWSASVLDRLMSVVERRFRVPV